MGLLAGRNSLAIIIAISMNPPPLPRRSRMKLRSCCLELHERGKELAVGGASEFVDLHISCGGVYKIGGVDSVDGDVAARHFKCEEVIAIVALYAEIHGGAFLTSEHFHDVGVDDS